METHERWRVHDRDHRLEGRQTGQGLDQTYFIRPCPLPCIPPSEEPTERQDHRQCPYYMLSDTKVKKHTDRDQGRHAELTREAALFGTGSQGRMLESGHP